MRELKFVELEGHEVREAVHAWLRGRGYAPVEDNKEDPPWSPLRIVVSLSQQGQAEKVEAVPKPKKRRGKWASAYMSTIIEELEKGPQPRRALIAACYGSEADPRKTHISGYLYRLMRAGAIERIDLGIYRLKGGATKT
jgi:hypothetical protein